MWDCGSSRPTCAMSLVGQPRRAAAAAWLPPCNRMCGTGGHPDRIQDERHAKQSMSMRNPYLPARVHGEAACCQRLASMRRALQREHQVGVEAAGDGNVLGWWSCSHGFRCTGNLLRRQVGGTLELGDIGVAWCINSRF